MAKQTGNERSNLFTTVDRPLEPKYLNAGRDIRYKYKHPIKFRAATAHLD
jgi:hypothetical protein